MILLDRPAGAAVSIKQIPNSLLKVQLEKSLCTNVNTGTQHYKTISLLN